MLTYGNSNSSCRSFCTDCAEHPDCQLLLGRLMRIENNINNNPERIHILSAYFNALVEVIIFTSVIGCLQRRLVAAADADAAVELGIDGRLKQCAG